jgi:hypothetical protein
MKYGEMFSSDEIIRLGKLLQDITTDLRNFESKFSTKIELIYNFYTNHWVIEQNLSLDTRSLKCNISEYYLDDGIWRMEYMPGLYPYVIGDHMFILKCSKPIPKYDEFIMTSLIQSKKGLEITNGKLSNIKFMENAPDSIILLEKKKLEDFGFKWELWTKAYLLFEI